jgi:hypothetical protein
MLELGPLVLYGFAMLALGWGFAKWLGWLGAREYRKEARDLAGINSLPLEEAERRARQYLAETDLFFCVEATRGATDSDSLAPALRQLLTQYEKIETVGMKAPECVMGRSLISPSAIKPGFVRVGTCVSGSMKGELAVRAGLETMYTLFPDEEPDPEFSTYTTVFHWILVIALEGGRS